MQIKNLKVAGVDYINVPVSNLSELGLSSTEINQILVDENTKNTQSEVMFLRQKLLAESDFYVMPDYPMDDKTKVESYRQALRDITQQAGYPFEIDWPEI